jgi:hypothetical protein
VLLKVSFGSSKSSIFMWIVPQTHSDHVLEPPDQRARSFLVQIEFTPHSLVHIRKVFGEMPVTT